MTLRKAIEGLRQIDSVRLDSVALRREIEPSTLLVRDEVLATLDRERLAAAPETESDANAWGDMLTDIIGLWGVGTPDKDDVLDMLAEHRPYIRAAAPSTPDGLDVERLLANHDAHYCGQAFEPCDGSHVLLDAAVEAGLVRLAHPQDPPETQGADQ